MPHTAKKTAAPAPVAALLFTLETPDFGPQFAFHATSETDAEDKAKGWCRYHSFCYGDGYGVKEISEADLPTLCIAVHDEFIR